MKCFQRKIFEIFMNSNQINEIAAHFANQSEENLKMVESLIHSREREIQEAKS